MNNNKKSPLGRNNGSKNYNSNNNDENLQAVAVAVPSPASMMVPTTRPNQAVDNDDVDLRPIIPPLRHAVSSSGGRQQQQQSTSSMYSQQHSGSRKSISARDKKGAAAPEGSSNKTTKVSSPKGSLSISRRSVQQRQRDKEQPNSTGKLRRQPQTGSNTNLTVETTTMASGKRKSPKSRRTNDSSQQKCSNPLERRTEKTCLATTRAPGSSHTGGGVNYSDGNNNYVDDANNNTNDIDIDNGSVNDKDRDDGAASQADETLSTVPDPPSLQIRDHITLRPGAYRMSRGGVARYVNANANGNGADLDNYSVEDDIADDIYTYIYTPDDTTVPFGASPNQDEPMPALPPIRPTTSYGSSYYPFHNNRHNGNSIRNNIEQHGHGYATASNSNETQSVGGVIAATPAAVATPTAVAFTPSATMMDSSSMKENSSFNKKNACFNKRNTMITIGLVLLFIVLLASIGTVYAVTGFGNKDNRENNDVSIGINDENQGVGDPSLNTPQTTPMFIFSQGLPEYTKESLEIPNSPQSKALNWMAEYDNTESYILARKLQRFALMTLTFSISNEDLSPTTLKWHADRNECDWYNSTCDGNIYTELWISSQKTIRRGTIVPELELISSLERLRMNQNTLVGVLPTELGQITTLKEIDMNTNLFRGTIPTEFGRLTNLEYVDFGDNLLSGTIPTEIGSWRKVKTLILSKNDLIGGIPSEIGQMNELESILVSSNKLSGPLPSEMGWLKTIKVFDARKNYLDGDFVSKFATSGYSTLEYLHLQSNEFSGTLPSTIGQLMTNLKELDVSENKLTGNLPPEVGKMTGLVHLDLSSNAFKNGIPSELGMLSNTENLLLYYNSFTGTIPEEICDLSDSDDSILPRENLVVDCLEVSCNCCSCPPDLL